MNEDEIDDMGMIAAALCVCAEEHEGDARLLGTVLARDVAKLCRWVLTILEGIEQGSAECGEPEKEPKP